MLSKPRDCASRLHALLDVMTGPVLVIDSEGRIIEMNRAAEELFLLDGAHARGELAWEALIPAADSARAKEHFHEAMAGRRTPPLELDVKTEKGGIRRVLWHYRIMRSDDGSVEYMLAVGDDVTHLRELEDRNRRLAMVERDRLRREEELRLSEAKFSGMVELSSEAIVSIDSEHRIVLFNQGAESIFGWRAAEVIGKPVDLLIPEGARGGHRAHVERFGASPVVSRRIGERREIKGVRKDGRTFPAEASIQKLDLSGQRLYTVVLRDITDTRRQQEGQRLLAEAGRVLASSLDEEESLRELAAVVTREWADFCLIDRIGRDGAVGRLEARHRDPDERDMAEAFRALRLERGRPHLMSPALGSGRPELIREVTEDHLQSLGQDAHHMELLHRLDPVSYIVAPLVAREEMLGVILFARTRGRDPFEAFDLSLADQIGRRAGFAIENTLLYRDAQRALQARDDVLGVVSHDLGNPLQAIFIGLESLERARARRGGDRPGQDEYYLTAIRRSAEVMERLIRDLLEIRRIEAGHLSLELEVEALAPLVREAMERIDPLARVKSVAIETELEVDTLPRVPIDGDRIQQVLSNLLGNAVKHAGEGGHVRILGRVVDGEVEIAVEDDGPGIAPEDLEQVFDRFWRGGSGRGTGIGLGLSIARGIVEGHGGRIRADSVLGEGTVFRFTLPMER